MKIEVVINLLVVKMWEDAPVWKKVIFWHFGPSCGSLDHNNIIFPARRIAIKSWNSSSISNMKLQWKQFICPLTGGLSASCSVQMVEQLL